MAKMDSDLQRWLTARGQEIARSLEQHRETICAQVTTRLFTEFPSLCLDTSRPDAAQFQALAFRQTPLRFHRQLQIVLRVRSLHSLEWEYRWSRDLLATYGIDQHHLVSAARWYFGAAAGLLHLSNTDRHGFHLLEATVVNIVLTASGQAIATLAQARD